MHYVATSSEIESLASRVIGAAIDVHTALGGPGLLESAYEECLVFELQKAGLKAERQKPVPVVYKEIRLDCGYRNVTLLKDGLKRYKR